MRAMACNVLMRTLRWRRVTMVLRGSLLRILQPLIPG